MADQLTPLTQEDVFSNDVDPLDGIRELRKAEGVAEEDLIQSEDSGLADNKTGDELPKEDDLSEFDKKDEVTVDKTEETEIVTDVKDAKTEEVAKLPEEGSELPAEEELDEKTGDENLPAVTTGKKFKANGQDFEFTQEEILEQFETVFGQAMDYTQKMQKIAPYRKMISALEEEGITQEQLNVALDALKGDKGALNKILEANEIDRYDLGVDDETPYTPKDYGKSEQQQSLTDVVSSISHEEEYKITVDVVDNQWDEGSRNTLRDNPKLIQALHNDIKSGVYDQVSPAAMKMKVLDGNTKSDIEYYILAGQQRAQQEQSNKSQKTVNDLNKQAQDAVDESDEASSEANRKRAATSTRVRADRKGVTDYLDDNDEDFDAWYKKTMSGS